MKIKPYVGLGIIQFTDSPQIIVEKFSAYKITDAIRKFLNYKQLSLFIEELNIHIIYDDASGSKIEYIENFGTDAFYDKYNIMMTDIKILINYFKKLDKNFKLIKMDLIQHYLD